MEQQGRAEDQGMTGHTPGPWIWRGKSGSLHQASETGSSHTYGQTVLSADYDYDAGVDTIVSQADARLIAAAPELLDALKLLLSSAHDFQTGIAEAEAAIAKATGAA